MYRIETVLFQVMSFFGILIGFQNAYADFQSVEKLHARLMCAQGQSPLSCKKYVSLNSTRAFFTFESVNSFSERHLRNSVEPEKVRKYKEYMLRIDSRRAELEASFKEFASGLTEEIQKKSASGNLVKIEGRNQIHHFVFALKSELIARMPQNIFLKKALEMHSSFKFEDLIQTEFRKIGQELFPGNSGENRQRPSSHAISDLFTTKAKMYLHKMIQKRIPEVKISGVWTAEMPRAWVTENLLEYRKFRKAFLNVDETDVHVERAHSKSKQARYRLATGAGLSMAAQYSMGATKIFSHTQAITDCSEKWKVPLNAEETLELATSIYLSGGLMKGRPSCENVVIPAALIEELAQSETKLTPSLIEFLSKFEVEAADKDSLKISLPAGAAWDCSGELQTERIHAKVSEGLLRFKNSLGVDFRISQYPSGEWNFKSLRSEDPEVRMFILDKILSPMVSLEAAKNQLGSQFACAHPVSRVEKSLCELAQSIQSWNLISNICPQGENDE